MNSFVEIQDLVFSYSTERGEVLRIPQFSVEKGERIFLYGASGSGKTTFLEILSGVLGVRQGHVKIGGEDLAGLTARQRDQLRSQKIGYIFQSFNLIPYLNVRENILLPLQLSGRDFAEKDLLHLAEVLQITSTLLQRVTELSVGQQQRVAVARALLGRPELLLADEPTSALDYDAREKFLKLMFQLCEEHQITVIFVSHDRSLKDLFSKQVHLQDINQRSHK